MNLIRFANGVALNMEMLHSIEPQSDGTIRLIFGPQFSTLLYRAADIELLNAWLAKQGVADHTPTQDAREVTEEMRAAGVRGWRVGGEVRDSHWRAWILGVGGK